MKNLTLKQLRYFEALAKHRHFGRAAEAAAISQPALSVQIRELEETLGTPLFERTRRQVHLTKFAEIFAPRAREILRAVDELSELVQATQEGLSGQIRIGVIPTIAPYLLPRLIGRLGQDHPKLDVHIRETVTQRLLQELDEGMIDAAVLALPVSSPNLQVLELFDEALVLVRPGDTAHEPMPAREDLADLRLLLLEEGHCFRDHALSFCNLPKTQPRDGLDGSSLSTLVQMVGAGIGVTLIPEMAVQVESRAAPVSIGRFPGVQPRRKIGMLWRKTSPLSAQMRDLGEIVKICAQEGRSSAAASTA